MNFKIVAHLVSVVMASVSAAMILSGGVSFLMRDPSAHAGALTVCGAALFVITAGCAFLTRLRSEADRKAGMREAFAIVGLSWIAASICGAVPYIAVSKFFWYDALFETASGFSTTGATIIDPGMLLRGGESLPRGVESLSYGILFWRSLTQWLGGMGIVVLSLAILPLMNIGGQMLYNAEVTGVKSMESKITPRIADSAKILWSVYIFMTLLETLLLRFGGMTWFDSVCHSFTTLATGGFSTKQNSLAFWPGAYIQWVIIIFMFLAGCNFVLHYHFLTRKRGQYLHDEEFRFYALLAISASVIVFLAIVFTAKTPDPLSGIVYSKHPGEAFRAAALQVVSLMSTTGFVSADYASWPAVACMTLYFLMFIASCGGSTAGGIKCVRVLLMTKYALAEIRRYLFPHRVQDIRLNGIRCENSTIQRTIGFCALFILLFAVFAMLLTFCCPGCGLRTALSASITSLSNVGPGFGKIGPCFTFTWMTPAAKLLLSFEMILGRLELYTLLVLFLPACWKK